MHQVLIIDDDPALLAITRLVLKAYIPNILIHAVTSTQQVFDILANHPIKAMSSDLNMPEMSGLDLLTRVRRSYPQLAVMLVSGDFDSTTLADANKIGVDYCLLKNGSTQDMVKAFTQLLNSNA